MRCLELKRRSFVYCRAQLYRLSVMITILLMYLRQHVSMPIGAGSAGDAMESWNDETYAKCNGVHRREAAVSD
jgi:hypothetical protein